MVFSAEEFMSDTKMEALGALSKIRIVTVREIFEFGD